MKNIPLIAWHVGEKHEDVERLVKTRNEGGYILQYSMNILKGIVRINSLFES